MCICGRRGTLCKVMVSLSNYIHVDVLGVAIHFGNLCSEHDRLSRTTGEMNLELPSQDWARLEV